MSAEQNPPAQATDVDDDAEMRRAFEAQADGTTFLDSLLSRELEVGEKADDAIDFEDISDDDLPEEEFDFDQGDTQAEDEDDNLEALFQDSGETAEAAEPDLDDLFGDNDLGLSSPVNERSRQEDKPLESVEHVEPADVVMNDDPLEPDFPTFGTTEDDDMDDIDPADREAWAEQRYLLGLSKKGPGGEKDAQDTQAAQAAQSSKPAPSREEFENIWPNFEPDKPPRFHGLVPRLRAFYVPKAPQKAPKPMVISKLTLEIAADQEKAFRLPQSTEAPKFARSDEDHSAVVRIEATIKEETETGDQMDLDELDTFDEREEIGKVSWNDIMIACEDWEIPDGASDGTLSDREELPTPPGSMPEDEYTRDFWPTKKRRLGTREQPVQFSVYDHMDLPTWDDPELETAKIAKKIHLDMNDPYLLLEEQLENAEPQKPRTTGLSLKRDNRGSLANPMFKRYNISNDEAYDALKESSQQKIRSTIGHMNVEHSMPALKLQYPFYKVQLSDRELRSFHRPTMTFKPNERVFISQLKSLKRKHKKNLKPSEAFATAEDLNVGDNSDLLLAEYSEEYPTTLSNFGMGVKILNYYRRKDNDDTSRPKPEDGVGETTVLLPQDKSPFSLFGQVEAGQQVLTLHNAMYRAPVFKHTPESTDFLVSRSTTGVNGSKYFMRSIPNLMVVGQQFPSVEVPGTHARKVTEASKKRLKMLAFRLYRRGLQGKVKGPWVSNEMIKQHLPGTEIAQNRSRMREIMKYDKDHSTWIPQNGEQVPEEDILRTWIKPEDVCLIDSMHAGDKQLQDAGIKANEIKDDDENQETENADLKLAPWNTTKNFLHACAQKAMLELHGEGDPTGQGLGFSFIKTSMKGGFRDIGESAMDRVDAKKLKELGGHSYNVQRQQIQYENAIKRIWNRQKESLSATNPPSEAEADVDTNAASNANNRQRSEAGTPAAPFRDDDTMSQFSRTSNAETRGKKLKITRTIKNKHNEWEEIVETVTDPEVIKLYLKHKKQERLLNMKIDEIKPTGDKDYDNAQMLKLKAEYARLARNIERREGREKAKGIHKSQTGEGGGPGKGGATPRKCANCGEVGHIKTNKKLCPLLNGQKKQSDTFQDAASAPTPAASVPATPQAFAGSPLW